MRVHFDDGARIAEDREPRFDVLDLTERRLRRGQPSRVALVESAADPKHGFAAWEGSPIPVERQVRAWKQVALPPYRKQDVDAFTRCRIILMNGLEMEAGIFSHAFARACDDPDLKGMLADMAQKNESLAIFTGGLKPTDQSCQDTNLLAAYPLFAKAPLPTFYVPGDAEWALCAKFTPADRLALLRKTFYQLDTSLGEPSLPLTRQPDHPELMRWQTGPALFVTLNVTGNNNTIRGNTNEVSGNRVPFDGL